MTSFRVGLLGYGTVGSAFARLLAERAAGVEHLTGLSPELSGVLTRSLSYALTRPVVCSMAWVTMSIAPDVGQTVCSPWEA